MTRTPRIAAGAVAAVLLTAGTAFDTAYASADTPGRNAGATDATQSAHRGSLCAGAWQLAIYEQPGEAPLRGLVSVAGNHTVTYGETSAISSLTPGVPVEFTSPGLGMASDTAQGCWYRIIVNAADIHGTYTRTSDIRGVAQVAPDGRSFAGPLTIAVTHADGSRFAFTTRASATRITV